MSSDFAIKVEGLSKCYQVYESPRDRLKQFVFPKLRRIIGKPSKQYFREFWALQDINIEVNKGSVVGVLGKNGAGKSTLLQIISGTLACTTGKVTINGRIVALLELGSGFNPEFTGIENIYMNGLILGLTKNQIDAKLPEIEEFADIGDFIHQPVKSYSSGMFARLAFAVSVHVEPDILIVDEALSVGDAWFQHKSMAKMRQLMSNGCAVLFVTHSIDSIRALCDEALWIDTGRIIMKGDVTSVTNAYMNDVFIEHNRITLESLDQNNDCFDDSQESSAPEREMNIDQEKKSKFNLQNNFEDVRGEGLLSVDAVYIKNSNDTITDKLEQGEKFTIECKVHFLKPVKNISIGFLIKNQFGQELTGESIFNKYRRSLDMDADQKLLVTFKSSMLLRGGQSYSVALRINQVSKWDRSDNVIVYADEIATVFDVLGNADEPMWFIYKQPFDISFIKG